MEPRSAWAGGAPDQELLPGALDPTQPAVLRPLCQLMQRAAEARTSQPAGAFHVSSHQYQSVHPLQLVLDNDFFVPLKLHN